MNSGLLGFSVLIGNSCNRPTQFLSPQPDTLCQPRPQTTPLNTKVVQMSLNSFPQEIIDEIITQVRYRDTLLTLPTKRDLLHTSLVSRKWVRQSQKMLYQEVYISWRRVDLRGRDTPQCATYIRHLSLQFNKWVVFPLKAVEDFIPRLKSFRNMRVLTLSVINMKRSPEPNIAVHFPSGLTALNLHKCHLKISTFVAFFSFLPVIREFRARKITLSGRAVIPTKPLPKSLIVLGIYPGYQTQQDIIFPLFTARSLAYQEMRFAGNVTVGHIRPLITASTRTLERLSLPTLPTCSCAPGTRPSSLFSKVLSLVQLTFCMTSVFPNA